MPFLERHAKSVVAARDLHGKRTRTGRAEPTLERGRAFGLECPVGLDRGERLVDVVEHDPHLLVAPRDLAREHAHDADRDQDAEERDHRSPFRRVRDLGLDVVVAQADDHRADLLAVADHRSDSDEQIANVEDERLWRCDQCRADLCEDRSRAAETDDRVVRPDGRGETEVGIGRDIAETVGHRFVVVEREARPDDIHHQPGECTCLVLEAGVRRRTLAEQGVTGLRPERDDQRHQRADRHTEPEARDGSHTIHVGRFPAMSMCCATPTLRST